MKIIFASYRDWAKEAVAQLMQHPKIGYAVSVSSIDELEHTVLHGQEQFDLVILCGWSWQVSRELLAKIVVVSEHPAERDEYSIGTPLQNQIVDGIKHTKHRVVKIGYPELSERMYSPAHEVSMSLEGTTNDILVRMRDTSIEIYTKFLSDYPDINWQQWEKAAAYRVPRKPVDSQLSKDAIAAMSTQQLYDIIRMLGDPYPRAFVEDEFGTLYFESARFVAKS